MSSHLGTGTQISSNPTGQNARGAMVEVLQIVDSTSSQSLRRTSRQSQACVIYVTDIIVQQLRYRLQGISHASA